MNGIRNLAIVCGLGAAAVIGSCAYLGKPKTVEAQVVEGIEIRKTESRGIPMYSFRDQKTGERAEVIDFDGNQRVGVGETRENSIGLTNEDMDYLIACQNNPQQYVTVLAE